MRHRNQTLHLLRRTRTLRDQLRGFEKIRRVVADFRRTRTGQQRQTKAFLRHIQQIARRSGIGLQQNLLGKRMTDIGRGNTRLIINFLLERKNQQHMINRLANFFNAFRTPCPDGWADIVHGGHALGAHGFFHA